ncbi:hypothetical protein ACVWWG_008929 [Bradyrhizobium sp. LB7.2]
MQSKYAPRGGFKALIADAEAALKMLEVFRPPVILPQAKRNLSFG